MAILRHTVVQALRGHDTRIGRRLGIAPASITHAGDGRRPARRGIVSPSKEIDSMGIRGCLAVLALGAGVPLASQAAVFTETFDSYSVPVGFYISLSSGTNIGGWSVGGAGVDIVSTQFGGGAWPATGANSLDLNGSDAGSIARTLTGLTAGTPYRLTFQFAANQDGLSSPGAPRPFTATFGTVSQTFASNSYSSFSNGMLTFTPTSTTALLRFAGNDGGPRGAILDNIVVTAVPEPHEWAMMLAGLGLVGWAARRGRRSEGAPALAAA